MQDKAILKYIPDEDQAQQLERYFKDLELLDSIRNDPNIRPFRKVPIIQRKKNQIIEKYSELLGKDLYKEIDLHLKLLKNEEKAKERQLIDFLDFIENTKIENSWVVQGLVPVDLLLIVADAKTGKSDLIANLCYSLITGNDFLGFPVKKDLKIGLGQLEEADHSILNKSKFHGFHTNKGKEALRNNPIKMFRYIDLYNEVDELIQIVDEHKLDIVIIDTAITAMSPSGVSVNQAEFTIPFRRLQTELCIRRKCAFLILHHTNKNGDIMGTNVLKSIGGGNWVISRVEKEKDTSTIKIQSRETGDKLLKVKRKYNDNLTVRYELTEETDEDNGLTHYRDRLIAFLLSVGEAKKPDIIVQLDIDETLCNDVMIDAINHQLVDFKYDNKDNVILFIPDTTRHLFDNNEYYKEYKLKLETINEITNKIENLPDNELNNYLQHLFNDLGDKYQSIWGDIYNLLSRENQVKLAMIKYPHDFHGKDLINNYFSICIDFECDDKGIPLNHLFNVYDSNYEIIESKVTKEYIQDKYLEPEF